MHALVAVAVRKPGGEPRGEPAVNRPNPVETLRTTAKAQVDDLGFRFAMVAGEGFEPSTFGL